MLPYFHASCHFSYSKCAHLYLQDMQNLKSTAGAEEYEKFTTQGNFTIHQTLKFWSGTRSAMHQQSLMKTTKTFGSLTHGSRESQEFSEIMMIAGKWWRGSSTNL
ncbi:hypothetical protein AVEN_21050-1 [Araneus ventricosus]|uniref:Uncharacterized protein n=1 Tax=Araneus ventricosus TaxID=182803 RepID=A0A4Y2UTG0_ARAVE|nr:hypothetical protein AVEN_21050-1 [Araneus ventricosus]